jgi:DNA-binding LacI/PurR family transcriptional regulator
VKKQPTIKDIAELLNLHHTTVSRALRDHPDVNPETRELVLETARKYNYIPNSFAKSLRSAKSKTLVVMVPVVKNFFFSEVLGVISNRAIEEDFSVMIYQSNEKEEIESKNLDVIMENRVAGVIASVADGEANREKYLQLSKLGIPVVLFDRCYANCPLPSIVIDNRRGAFEATGYLIASGRREIAFYRAKPGNPVFDSRFAGYVDALGAHGIPFREDLVYEGGIGLEEGRRFVSKLSRRKRKADAALCSVDMVALGVITGARELGLEIPGHMALIGFDDEPSGRIIRPALTTVAQPVKQVGDTAFDLLLSQIRGTGELNERETVLKMELIKRSSA